MDMGTILSAAQTLFTALHCKELQEMCFLLGYKSQLKDLERTVSTVKAVLLDVDTKEVLSNQAQIWVEELKNAVYDADDLLDKFVTVIHQNQRIKGGSASKKVRIFFSRYNPLALAYSMSQGVKKIRKNLDAIANNRTQFGFSHDPPPIRVRKREETCSYVYQGNIIGREDDVEKIVAHLLNDDCNNKQVSFLTIVGIGGLGKTTLAQLVYNDARVASEFSLRIWTCVSDHDQERLNVEEILRKILNSNNEESTKELLHSQVRFKLTNNKYLLVLDDVWTENRDHWLKLEDFLLGCQRGSWVVITTRSHKTANIIDGQIIHELQGLSKEKSMCLFRKVAFGSEQLNSYDELVEIGQEIVEGCARVPLAIRVAGSLLYGQDKSKWLSLKKIGFLNFKESEKDIMPILKLSYHKLESQLKSCFTYCAMFPKGYVIDVPKLKSLWMAQGYIVSSNEAQSMEHVADEYFSILLRRCFFQDVIYNTSSGDIISCKIHDLMHDVAQRVAGKEIYILHSAEEVVDKRARHLGYTSKEAAQHNFTKTRLRSCLYVGPLYHGSREELTTTTLEALLSKWKCLRVLDLNNSDIKKLTESIGELLHLRYLNLGDNINLEVIPNSITKLYNLQTLKIGGCSRLKKLPKDIIKLVNMRKLTIEECGIKYLTCLGSLPHLKYLKLDKLKDLEYIIENNTIRGSMSSLMTLDDMMGAKGYVSFPCLESLELFYLRKLKGWVTSRVEVGDGDSSSQGSLNSLLLPELKALEIEDCPVMKCNMLLPNLEVLHLVRFNEDLRINRTSNEDSSSTNLSTHFYGIRAHRLKRVYINNVAWLNRMPMESFRCLVELVIWWDRELECLREVEEVFRSCSSSLAFFRIHGCHKLRSVMSGGLKHLNALENLEIHYCNMLSLSGAEENEDGNNDTGLPWSRLHKCLRRLSLRTLPEMMNLPDWIQFLSTLETLEIYNCKALETMPDWMLKLTSLKQLRLHYNPTSLYKRCQNITGEDWSLIQSIPSIDIL